MGTTTNREEDRIYYSRRAEVERARATACGDRAVALAHAQMAAEYERRLRTLAETEPDLRRSTGPVALTFQVG